MNRRNFISIVPGAGFTTTLFSSFSRQHVNRLLTVSNAAPISDRTYCANLLYRIAKPVLQNINNQTLKQQMPLEKPDNYNTVPEKLSYLEAFGRTICGIAPWLALPDDTTPEGMMRSELRAYAIKGMHYAVDPASPDYMNFRELEPPLVHAAHLCQGIMRAPKILWEPLSQQVKDRWITELKTLRRVKGPYNNWLLFAAMIETFFAFADADYEPWRIMIAIKKLQEWYVGDGWYKDGDLFAFDYYNGYVIHSMLVDVLKIAITKNLATHEEYQQAIRRMQRFAIIQERLIAPDGTYPAVGRSMTYRTAAFQPLAQLTLQHQLPEELSAAQVRCALTAVMKRLFEAKGTFNAGGWLQLGIAGHQPHVADEYTSTGSLYICTEGFLALGLPPDDSYWTSAAQSWTAQKIWSGQDLKPDHAWKI